VAIDNLKGLITLVQMGVLEFHISGSGEANPEHPDYVVFDLDPGPGVEWAAVNLCAQRLRDRLGGLGLTSFIKTSGGKGYHVVIPVKPKADWDQIKDFTRSVGSLLMKDHPGEYLITMTKAKREGKIFIDYLRNGRGATSVAPFSTRARPGATISMPISWNSLPGGLGDIQYTVLNVPTSLRKRRKDPWSNLAKARQSITTKLIKEVEDLLKGRK
jgi:bifunctional non-homologous end joining protein LigD